MKWVCIVVMGALLSAISGGPSEAPQVAPFFVHGKGSANLVQKGNAWWYWDAGKFMTLANGGCVPCDYSAVDG